VRDADAVTSHRITYEGPPLLAVQTASMLADAAGVELTASQPPQRLADRPDTVVLAIVVDGTTDAVMAAVRSAKDRLPAGATLVVDDASDE
jgi:hypothetical protein